MYVRIILLILGWIISCHGTQFTPRIVGGQDAQIGKYPYQAMIKQGYSFICGGSIVSQNIILTAAHCVYQQNPKIFRVTVGTYHLYSTTGTTYFVEKLIWHSDYDKDRLQNDIGLIRLTKRISFTNGYVEPVLLVTGCYIKPNSIAVVTGWGKMWTSGTVSPYLQEIQLKVIPKERCRLSWPVDNSQICTLTVKNEGVCNGDSGGPLVVNGSQVGIVSYGDACAHGLPDVYTNVCFYKDWIAHQIRLAEHNGAANALSNIWIQMLLATLTCLHFFA